ncbi:hypothetical protein NMY22_g17621 [Coprinellus aureogranulatus]|nr:hypothetical protein NMY22_g17621 [Coprinellus aureogranulatus]
MGLGQGNSARSVPDMQRTTYGLIIPQHRDEYYVFFDLQKAFYTLNGPIEALQPIPDASHNRNRRTSPPDSCCLPGTRELVLSRILSWAKADTDAHGQVILWLCGSVGSGKSAISQAVAEDLDRCNRLAASFFFFRSSGERSKFTRFAVTVASQMAMAIPETAPYVLEAMDKVNGWSVSKQMEALVYRPLQLAFAGGRSGGPVITLIDGLDECEDRDEVAEFIDHALDYLGENISVSVRFIIASRIEQHIQARLESELVRIENLTDYASDEDIKTFLKVSFSRAAKQSRVIRAYGRWPTETDLVTLMEHIRGSFIFASTVVKYILGSTDDGLTPMERLPLALKMDPGLDGLYKDTLSRCSNCPYFKDVIAAVVLELAPLTISELSQLLHIPTFRVLNILVNLQAIIHVPGDDHSPVTIFHTSLHDFLTSRSRAGSFHLPAIHHEYLALKWLEDEPAGTGHLGGGICRRCNSAECDTIRHAVYHWKRGMRAHDEDGEPQLLQLLHGLVKHHYPSSRLVTGDTGPWASRYHLLYSLVFLVMNRSMGWHFNLLHDPLRDVMAKGPPHIPHCGCVRSILVHTAIRFFNGCLQFDPGSKAGDYMLRYWIQHLAAAFENDRGVTLEFLQRRVYDAVEHRFHPRYRTFACSISLDSNEELAALKQDVLVAERAIENRFPGTTSPGLGSNNLNGSDVNFKMNVFDRLVERLRHLGVPVLHYHIDGISVLDVFNAYRTFLFMGTTPIENIFSQDQPSHFDIIFNPMNAKNNLRSELCFRRHPPGPASMDPEWTRPVYIIFNLDYFVF